MDARVQDNETLTTGMFGPSVYAHVDPGTLAALDRNCDQDTMPRSWLITRILQQWAAEHARPKQAVAA